MKKVYTQTFPDERVQAGKTIDKYLKVLSIQRTAPNAKENLLPEELIKLLTERDPDGWYKSTERNYATRMQHDTKKPGKTGQNKKRETGFEPAAPTLARWCSTTEPLAHTKYLFS